MSTDDGQLPARDRPHYAEHAPSPELAPYVECIWTITAADASGAINRVFPDGCADVIFDLGARGDERRDDGARAIVVGAMRSSRAVRLSGRVDLVGVRFHPGGAAPVLGTPLHELTDVVAPLDALWAVAAAPLVAALGETSSLEARIAEVERLLVRRVRAAPPRDPAVAHAVMLLQRRSGLAVPVLAEATGLSARQLERRFHAQTGLAPKELGRIVRLRRVIAAMQRDPRTNGAALALAHGFSDQAHFIRDFKALVGITPRAYAAEWVQSGFVAHGAARARRP